MSQQLWPLWLLQGLLGWLLFSQAHLLVESPVFRLGSGTAGFVLLSTLIVAFIIYRCFVAGFCNSISLQTLPKSRRCRGRIDNEQGAWTSAASCS